MKKIYRKCKSQLLVFAKDCCLKTQIAEHSCIILTIESVYYRNCKQEKKKKRWTITNIYKIGIHKYHLSAPSYCINNTVPLAYASLSKPKATYMLMIITEAAYKKTYWRRKMNLLNQQITQYVLFYKNLTQFATA